MQRPTTMGRHDARAATGAELIAPTMPLSCAPSLAASSSCQLDNTNNTDTQGNVCRYANDTVYHHRRHPSTGSPREVRGAMDHTSAAHRPCVEQAAALPQPPAVEALQVIDRLRWWRLQRVSEQPLPPHHYIFSNNYSNYSAFGTRPLSSRLTRLMRELHAETEAEAKVTMAPDSCSSTRQLGNVAMRSLTTPVRHTALVPCMSSSSSSSLFADPMKHTQTAKTLSAVAHSAPRPQHHQQDRRDDIDTYGGADSSEAQQCYLLAEQKKMCEKRAALCRLRGLLRPRASSAPVTHCARTRAGVPRRGERSALLSSSRATVYGSTQTMSGGGGSSSSTGGHLYTCAGSGGEAGSPHMHSGTWRQQKNKHTDKSDEEEEEEAVEDDEVAMGAPAGSVVVLHSPARLIVYKQQLSLPGQSAAVRLCMSKHDVASHACMRDSPEVFALAQLPLYSFEKYFYTEQLRLIYEAERVPRAAGFSRSQAALSPCCVTPQGRLLSSAAPLQQITTRMRMRRRRNSCDARQGGDDVTWCAYDTRRAAMRNRAAGTRNQNSSSAVCSSTTLAGLVCRANVHLGTAASVVCEEEEGALCITRSDEDGGHGHGLRSHADDKESETQHNGADDDDGDDRARCVGAADMNCVPRTHMDSPEACKRSVSVSTASTAIVATCAAHDIHSNSNTITAVAVVDAPADGTMNDQDSSKHCNDGTLLVPCTLRWRTRRRAASVPCLPFVSYYSRNTTNNSKQHARMNSNSNNNHRCAAKVSNKNSQRDNRNAGSEEGGGRTSRRHVRRLSTHMPPAVHRSSDSEAESDRKNAADEDDNSDRDDQDERHVHRAIVAHGRTGEQRRAREHSPREQGGVCRGKQHKNEKEEKLTHTPPTGRVYNRYGGSHHVLCRDVEDLQDVYVFNAMVDCIGQGAFSHVYAAIPIFHRVGSDDDDADAADTADASSDDTVHHRARESARRAHMCGVRRPNQTQPTVVAIKVIPRKAKRRVSSVFAPPARAGAAGVHARDACAHVTNAAQENHARVTRSNHHLIHEGHARPDPYKKGVHVSNTYINQSTSAHAHAAAAAAAERRSAAEQTSTCITQTPPTSADCARVHNANPSPTSPPREAHPPESSQRRELVEIEREIAVLRGLRHSGCSLFYEAVRTRDEFVIAMKLHHDSINLRQLLTRFGLLSESRVALLLLQLLETVSYLHNTFGLIHRDIKLENLLVSRVSAPEDLIVHTLGPHLRKTAPVRPHTCAKEAEPNPNANTNVRINLNMSEHAECGGCAHTDARVGERKGYAGVGCGDAARYRTLGSTPDRSHASGLLRLTLIDFGLSRRTHLSHRPVISSHAHPAPVSNAAKTASHSHQHDGDHGPPHTSTRYSTHTMHTPIHDAHNNNNNNNNNTTAESDINHTHVTTAMGHGHCTADLYTVPTPPRHDPVQRIAARTDRRRGQIPKTRTNTRKMAIPTPLPSTANLFSAYYDTEDVDESVTVGLCSTDASTTTSDDSAKSHFSSAAREASADESERAGVHGDDDEEEQEEVHAGEVSDNACEGQECKYASPPVLTRPDDVTATNNINNEVEEGCVRVDLINNSSGAPEQPPPWLMAAVSHGPDESALPTAIPVASVSTTMSTTTTATTTTTTMAESERRWWADARMGWEAPAVSEALVKHVVRGHAGEGKSRSYSYCSKSAGFAVSQQQQQQQHIHTHPVMLGKKQCSEGGAWQVDKSNSHHTHSGHAPHHSCNVGEKDSASHAQLEHVHGVRHEATSNHPRDGAAALFIGDLKTPRRASEMTKHVTAGTRACATRSVHMVDHDTCHRKSGETEDNRSNNNNNNINNSNHVSHTKSRTCSECSVQDKSSRTYDVMCCIRGNEHGIACACCCCRDVDDRDTEKESNMDNSANNPPYHHHHHHHHQVHDNHSSQSRRADRRLFPHNEYAVSRAEGKEDSEAALWSCEKDKVCEDGVTDQATTPRSHAAHAHGHVIVSHMTPAHTTTRSTSTSRCTYAVAHLDSVGVTGVPATEREVHRAGVQTATRMHTREMNTEQHTANVMDTSRPCARRATHVGYSIRAHTQDGMLSFPLLQLHHAGLPAGSKRNKEGSAGGGSSSSISTADGMHNAPHHSNCNRDEHEEGDVNHNQARRTMPNDDSGNYDANDRDRAHTHSALSSPCSPPPTSDLANKEAAKLSSVHGNIIPAASAASCNTINSHTTNSSFPAAVHHDTNVNVNNNNNNNNTYNSTNSRIQTKHTHDMGDHDLPHPTHATHRPHDDKNMSYSSSAATDDEDTILLLTPCGTEKYMAPEMLDWIVHRGWTRRPASVAMAKKMDVYAIGIVAHVLLSGCFPFNANSNVTLAQQQRRIPRCNSVHWRGVSSEAISFVQALLRPDPQDRLTVKEALQHPFIQHARRAAEKLRLIPHPYDTDTRQRSRSDVCSKSVGARQDSADAAEAMTAQTGHTTQAHAHVTRAHDGGTPFAALVDHTTIQADDDVCAPCACNSVKDALPLHRDSTRMRCVSRHMANSLHTGDAVTEALGLADESHTHGVTAEMKGGSHDSHAEHARAQASPSARELVAVTECRRRCSPEKQACMTDSSTKEDALLHRRGSPLFSMHGARDEGVAKSVQERTAVHHLAASQRGRRRGSLQSPVCPQSDDDDLFAQLYFNIMSADG